MSESVTVMLLAIDIGNTQTVLGVYEDEKLAGMWRLATSPSLTSDEIRVHLIPLFSAANLSFQDIDCSALSSVVPQLTESWKKAIFDCTGIDPLICNAETAGSLFRAHYPSPHEIGADRVADSVAMLAIYGAPCIVVDFGTATNMEVIDAQGYFIGGIIAPGMQTSAQTLFARGAQLPAIGFEAPKDPIGKNTIEAMQSGIVLGEVDRVDGLIKRVFDQLGYEAKVVATGGLAGLVAKHSKYIEEVNLELTLIGLRLILEHNRSGAADS